MAVKLTLIDSLLKEIFSCAWCKDPIIAQGYFKIGEIYFCRKTSCVANYWLRWKLEQDAKAG